MTPADQLPEIDAEPVTDADLYWATKKSSELISVLSQKETDFFQTLRRRGLLRMWRVMWAQYYGQDPDNIGGFESQMISVAGEDGELLNFRLNKVRPLISRQIQMAVGERAAFQCHAVNSDYSTKASINTCDSIVEYVYREAHAERKERDIVESDSNFGAGFGWARWDADGGDEVEVTEQLPTGVDGATAPVPTMKRAGAPTVTVVYPWEMVQETSTRTHMWRMVRERASKWELIARYPEHGKELRAVRSMDEYTTEALFGFDTDHELTSDEVIVKHFYHERNAALPNGRYVGICGSVVLWDLPCPVSKGLPIIEMCSERFVGTSFGYSNGWELIAPSQLSDQITSDMASNLATFGRQVIGVYDGTKFDVDALANGMRVLSLPSGGEEPVALNFAGIPEAARWGLEYLDAQLNNLSGINAAAQGNPGAQVGSGTYGALLHAIAIEFQGPRQTAFDGYREGMANLLLDLVRQRAAAPFLVEVAGLDERPYLKEFTADNLSGVKRVVVKTANPMMRSQAGRFELYNAVKDIPNPLDRAAAMELLITGSSKDFAKVERAEEMAIAYENEQLSAGMPCPVLYSDHHEKHWRKHKAELDARRPEMMTNPGALEAYLEHMLEHENTYATLTTPIVSMWNQMPPSPMYGMPPAAPANDQGMAPEGAMASGQATQPGPGTMAVAGPTPGDPAAAAGAAQPKPAKPAQPPGGAPQNQGEAA